MRKRSTTCVMLGILGGLIFALVCAATQTGCQAVAGLGRDISACADGMSKESAKTAVYAK